MNITTTNRKKIWKDNWAWRLLIILAVTTLSASRLNAQSMKKHDTTNMNWWENARFGMFIHWGLYSEAAGYWDGKPNSGAGEWLMTDAHIPRQQYEKLAAKFDPVDFNAKQWAKIAKEAGMKYMVITTKHHDGFLYV